MSKLQNNISYLRGLAEGIDLSKNSKEGKLINEIISVIEDMSDSIFDLENNQDDLEEYVVAIDEDLDELEEEAYGDLDFPFGDQFEVHEFDQELFEAECPTCHKIIYVEQEVLDDESAVLELSCPDCRESL